MFPAAENIKKIKGEKSDVWKQDTLRWILINFCNIILPKLPGVTGGSFIFFQISWLLECNARLCVGSG